MHKFSNKDDEPYSLDALEANYLFKTANITFPVKDSDLGSIKA